MLGFKHIRNDGKNLWQKQFQRENLQNDKLQIYPKTEFALTLCLI